MSTGSEMNMFFLASCYGVGKLHNRLHDSDCDETNNHCEKNDNKWFEKLVNGRCEIIHLFVIELCNFDNSFVEIGSLFPYLNHLNHDIRKKRITIK